MWAWAQEEAEGAYNEDKNNATQRWDRGIAKNSSSSVVITVYTHRVIITVFVRSSRDADDDVCQSVQIALLPHSQLLRLKRKHFWWHICSFVSFVCTQRAHTRPYSEPISSMNYQIIDTNHTLFSFLCSSDLCVFECWNTKNLGELHFEPNTHMHIVYIPLLCFWANEISKMLTKEEEEKRSCVFYIVHVSRRLHIEHSNEIVVTAGCLNEFVFNHMILSWV